MIVTRLLGSLLLALPLVAAAQGAKGYPERPVRVIVPAAAGGGQDIVSRALAQRLTEQLGQTFVVDNRGGGGGTVGADLAMQSPPDGHTMILMSATAVIHPILYASRYDILKDFVALSQVTQQPYVLVVHPSVPAKTPQEFVAYAKANPGKLNYSSSGQGSLIHLANELLNSYAGIKTVHVPYKGTGAAYPDLIAGHIQLTFANITSAQPHVRSGRLRALAVSGVKRAQSSPELPTLTESGVKGYDVTNWYGMFLPAKTPKAIVDKLGAAVIQAANHPEVGKRLAADGTEAVGNTPAEFTTHLRNEIARWTKVVKDTGIKGD
jgi:tripartite-type tricarboxylate transporter receptor subunit TctC